MYVNEEPADDIFGRLNLDTTVFHESAHYLHRLKHGGFEDIDLLELIIDCSVVHHIRWNGLMDHLQNFLKI